MSKPIQESLQLIKQAQMQVNKNLAAPEHNGNLLNINALFQQLISRLVFMGGILEPDTAEPKTKLQPMTRFMGRELKKEKVTSASLDPDEDEKQKFFKRVDKLYNEICSIQPGIILNSYTIPEDITVLRRVAKEAGVPGFESKELNIAFIEEIQLAIKEKKETDQLQKIVDTSAKKGNEVTVTQEMIDSSKFLQKEKVKPGEKVLQMLDGKYKLLATA